MGQAGLILIAGGRKTSVTKAEFSSMKSRAPRGTDGRWPGWLDGGNVTAPPFGMALTNAEKQRRWRQKRSTLAQTDPRAIEDTLLQEAERLADRAKELLWRAHELSQIAFKLRTSRDHPAVAQKDTAKSGHRLIG